MSAENQVDQLAKWILANIPEEIGNEGAGDVAIRVLEKYHSALRGVMAELGVPGAGYPAPAANAYEVARDALVPNPILVWNHN